MKRNEIIMYEHKKGVRARKYNTKYVDPTKKSDTLIEPAKPPKKKEVDEASKKPNATTRHLRDYPVSDKDVAKPVKKPEKKKPEQGMAESRFGRSSYYNPMDQERREQDAMDYERRAFKRAELQHELGHEDDPDFERKMRQQEIDRDRGPWYLIVNGKVLKVGGEAKVFDWKRGANNYGLAILKKRPELQGKIQLTKKLPDQTTEDAGDQMGTISAATPDGKVKIKTAAGQEIETTKDQLVPGEGGSVQMKPAAQDAFKPGTKVTTPAVSTESAAEEDMMVPPTDSRSPIHGDEDHDEVSKLLVHRLKRLAGL